MKRTSSRATQREGGEAFLFRGTSTGFPGHPGLQRLSLTPATTDPIVATLFATESANFGFGVVHIATHGELTGVEIVAGNVLATLEKEVAIRIKPREFAQKAGLTLIAAEARNILRNIGIALPHRIANKARLSEILHTSPRLTQEQIFEFVRQARGLKR